MTRATTAVADLPYLGSGMGYRSEIRDAILESRAGIDFLEVLTDQYLDVPWGLDEIAELASRFPVIPHGIGLSVGSVTGLDPGYLAKIKAVSDATGSPYYSEHLCITRAPGLEIGHLSPLAFTEDVLARTIANIDMAQDILGKPLILENVTYHFAVPHANMTQGEFFVRLVDATGCGVLLDVTNVFINAKNHGFDPIEFLDSMPLARVVQVHIAGGYWAGGVLIDSHSEEVPEEIWSLLETVAARTSIRGCILEHDANFPETLLPILNQLARARSILSGSSVGKEAQVASRS